MARNVISRDIRSQSEYQMRKPTPGPALNQRAASYNDDSDLFSEITVCMSQVRVSSSSSLYNGLYSGLVLVEVLDLKLEEAMADPRLLSMPFHQVNLIQLPNRFIQL